MTTTQQNPITQEQLEAAKARSERAFPRDKTPARSVAQLTKVTPCKACGEMITYVPLKLLGKDWVPEYCDKCDAKMVHDRNKEIISNDSKNKSDKKSRLVDESWKILCPKKYRTIEEGGETELEKLPKEKLARVLSWTPEQRPRGLVLHGETGRCKTRLIWRLLRKLHERGMKIVAFDCVSFGHECAQHFRDGTEQRWLKNIMSADVVFFDDLWKLAMTERVDSELFGIIEKLGSECKPYFATTNFTGESLIAESKKPNSRISYDRAIALHRRLTDDCLPISFK